MQIRPQFGPFRRVLLPHTGEEPLTPSQGRRLVFLWALIFTAPMVLCTLSVTLLAKAPVDRMALLVGIVFLSGVFIFGLSAWVVVKMINRSARMLQERRARTSSGGRYGS